MPLPAHLLTVQREQGCLIKAPETALLISIACRFTDMCY